MAVLYDQQNRPITASATVGEVGDGDGLSTRAVRDGGRTLNNIKGRTLPRVAVYQVWQPILTITNAAYPALAVVDGAQWGPVPAWAGFTTYQVKLWGRVQNAGSGTVKISSDFNPYTTTFSGVRSSVTLTVNATTNAYYEGELTILRATPDQSFIAMEATVTGAASPMLLGILEIWHKPLANV
ncbi:MAG: hypothetical protein Q8S13_00280 [Dehalococcoidia bacterium]|nr:hypothetical protein [Dehalococcoidia bacterium]